MVVTTRTGAGGEKQLNEGHVRPLDRRQIDRERRGSRCEGRRKGLVPGGGLGDGAAPGKAQVFDR